MWEWIIDIIKQVAIVLLSVGFLFLPGIRDFIVKKVQLSFDKALEDRKSLNEQKTYISKVRFDKEFQIYTELSEKTLDAIFELGEIVNFFNIQGSLQNFIDTYNRIIRKYNEANTLTQKYAPFIDEKIYNEYFILFSKFRKILKYFECWKKAAEQFGVDKPLSDLPFNDWKISIASPFLEQSLKAPEDKAEIYSEKELISKILIAYKDLQTQSDKTIITLRKYLETMEVMH